MQDADDRSGVEPREPDGDRHPGPAAPRRMRSPFERSLLVGYAGRVGRERRAWCERYITWKTALLDGVKRGQEQAEIRLGRKITCLRGCWSCCTHYIVASLQECEAIVYWLSQHPEIRDGFIERYAAWRARLRKDEAVFQDANQALAGHLSNPDDPARRGDFYQKGKIYRNLDVQCPFLADGECSIYPVRPLTCAKHVVASPPAWCAHGSTEMPEVLQGGRTPNDPPYFRMRPGTSIAAPAALLVHEILLGDLAYLSEILGCPDLATESADDPEVKALLQAQGHA